ncbi:MAG: Dam family site-specific DNA-(adenine-N6)-methyltransferase [Candidatus Phytoplasma sp. TWB_XP]
MKINWIGCKKKLLPQIIAHLPKQFKTYYEPFLGSGVLYFYLKTSKAILNDNDHQLITMWKQSLQNPHHFVNKVKAIENYIYQYHNQKNQKQAFKHLLNQYNQNAKKRKKLTRSAIFYVLNKYAFRGVFKYQKNGKIYMSFVYQKSTKKPIIDLEELQIIKNNFTNSKLLNIDFESVINQSKSNDFIFVDPPYFQKDIKDKDFYQNPFTFTTIKDLNMH